MEVLNDPTKHVQSIMPIGDDMLMLRYEPIEDADHSLSTSSVIHAAQTTAFARIRLYRYLQKVGKRVLYHDTGIS